jgi:hypothetical protein
VDQFGLTYWKTVTLITGGKSEAIGALKQGGTTGDLTLSS